MVLEWQGSVSRFQNSCEKVKSDLKWPFEPRSKKYQNLTISEAQNRRKISIFIFEKIKKSGFIMPIQIPHYFWVFMQKESNLGLTQLRLSLLHL